MSIFTRYWASLWAASAVLIGATTCDGTPAPPHNLAGLEAIDVRVTDSVTKFQGVNCPPGKQLVGVGSGVTPQNNGQLIMDGVAPSSSLNSVVFGASEDETGFAGNWTMVGRGICANPVPGLQLVTTPSGPLNSDSTKTAVANCPPVSSYSASQAR